MKKTTFEALHSQWRGALIIAVLLILGGAAVASPGAVAPELESEFVGASDPDGPDRAPGTSPAQFSHEATRAAFDVQRSFHALNGRSLVDIEVRWDGTEERYTAVWFPLSGSVHTLIQGTPTEWGEFHTSMAPLAGRFLDVEVGYFGGEKKYSAIFYQDGDDYNFALHTTNTDLGFQSYLDTYQRQGRSIIDFEAYRLPSGDTRFAGVWVDDPNQPQTHLLYHLESADISVLLRPMQGRVIDVERYYSSLHNEDRYAVILAVLPGGGWGHYRELTSTQLTDKNDLISGTDTHLIDLDPVVNSSGLVRYNAVWGNNFKSLNEVAAMPAPIDPEPLTPELSALVTEFETTAAVGTVGFYAKNLRTDQSVSYRGDELAYLASSTKIAIHIKFWQDAQNGRFYPSDALQYTSNAVTGSPWYVDERPYPGFATGAPGFTDNRGGWYALDRFDSAMMTRSDNGATSALVLDPDIGAAYAAQDLTEWMASEVGIGSGWGIVTAIQDVDRHIMWQGQQTTDHAAEQSYFRLPLYAFGPRLRYTWGVCTVGGTPRPNCVDFECQRCDAHSDCMTGQTCVVVEDPWRELADYFGMAAGATTPRVNLDVGRSRYYASGLNSATPRAVGNLWEGLLEGRFLNPGYTENAVNSLDTWAPLTDGSRFPGSVTMRAKGGSRATTCIETGVYQYGDENIVVSVQTKDLTRPCSSDNVTNDVREIYMPVFGEELLFALATDLEVVNPATDAAIGPAAARPGENLIFFATVTNKYGGDADPVDVRLVLSTNTDITQYDPIIGVGRTNLIPGNDSEMVLETGTLPTLAPGMYYFGWLVDFGEELPEIDEANTGYLPVQFQVQASLVEIDDLRFSDKTTAIWTPTADTAYYWLHEGTSTTLPLLRTNAVESCRLDVASAATSTDFARTPPPGELHWYLVQAENDGPIANSSYGSRSVDSIGVCGTSCAHSKCEIGDVVDPICDTCVGAVCDYDSYCCNTTWDSLCVQHVRTVCNSLTCDESAGTCDHPVCTEGTALVSGCDDPPVSPSCVTAICDFDSYCCTNLWDDVCVGWVDNYCGATCE